MKEANPRVSYVLSPLTQEEFNSERNDTGQNTEQDLEQNLSRDFHIKYPVQSLLSHFKNIFNDRSSSPYLGATKCLKYSPAGSCWSS